MSGQLPTIVGQTDHSTQVIGVGVVKRAHDV
jgi:hypothetical protein